MLAATERVIRYTSDKTFDDLKARLLFEQERISEGHYVELLNLLK